ncbi:hypothetical protein K461DRAFT_20242 [Myriangium duriaei CBS 260.36]|uniref:Trafficking protein particle complex subunit 12 n=1 Tax=Myriangium duriaei CBS 260.36 TaxID=1168546 RepID=A0A9P4MLQ4_9PEZI|nr:hypothetical protein K461DRAFT_20242 [Myriangium duriaei CBS 260.36]
MQVPSEIPVRSRSGRHAAVRRSTRGPLDDDDPLAASLPVDNDPSPISSPKLNIDTTSARPSTSSSLLSPPGTGMHRPPSPSSPSQSPTRSQLDLSLLLRPSLYQSIPTDSTLPPFLSADHQPPPGASLSSLISTCQFRHAAIKAASDLCTGIIQPTDPQRILETFHIRLACLVLTGNNTLAAQESRALSDYLSRNTRPGQTSPAIYLPWELRLLLHRLQSRVSADGRRSIMSLYTLGGECRTRAAAALDDEERILWTRRLADLGLRVAAELIEMGEFDAAARHLQSLDEPNDDSDALVRKALLQLRIGDVAAAETTVNETKDGETNDSRATLRGLTQLARGDYTAAMETFAALHETQPQDIVAANNYAVSLLYTGKMDAAAPLLEALVDGADAIPAPGVLFNLATFYELATERAVDRKVRLVERVAARGAEQGGWERVGAEFKL